MVLMPMMTKIGGSVLGVALVAGWSIADDAMRPTAITIPQALRVVYVGSPLIPGDAHKATVEWISFDSEGHRITMTTEVNLIYQKE